MILLLDWGNSRLKWALADGGQGLDRQGFLGADSDFDALPWQGVAQVLIASVRQGPGLDALQAWVHRRVGQAPTLLETPQAYAGLQCAYSEPQRLGVDRWLAMLGAWRRLQSGFTVVDAGTAVTLDLVAPDGRHLGGAILPGLDFMVSALVAKTSGIRPRPDDGEPRYPARDTGAGVRAGALMAVLGAVRHAMGRADELGVAGPLLLTGGDAGKLQAELSAFKPQRVETLVFEGMLEMARC